MSDSELSAGIRHLVRCASKLDDVISRVPESAWSLRHAVKVGAFETVRRTQLEFS